MFNFVIVILVVVLHLTVNIAFEIQPRIIRGNPARSGQFPYFAYLESYIRTEYGPTVQHIGSICGAAIISNEWLLTAAHCLNDVKHLKALFGATSLQFKEPGDFFINITRDNFHVHPEYTKGSTNDIGINHRKKCAKFGFELFDELYFHSFTALIKLPYQIRFSANIQPARLPTTCDAPQDGTAVAMGYGGSVTQLQYAVLHIRPYNIFCDIYKDIEWDDSRICAFDDIGHQSTCHGDSGGPLVRRRDNTLVGILNFGPSGKTKTQIIPF